jgi:hypothetical protein
MTDFCKQSDVPSSPITTGNILTSQITHQLFVEHFILMSYNSCHYITLYYFVALYQLLNKELLFMHY